MRSGQICWQKTIWKKIILLSLKAGNVGLNLTKADFVDLIDPL